VGGRGTAALLPHSATPSALVRRPPEIHGKPKKDPFREDRIHNEAIVDTYGPEAQALGWYYYCAIDIVHRGEWGHVAALVPLADAIATNRKVDPEPIEVANRILESF